MKNYLCSQIGLMFIFCGMFFSCTHGAQKQRSAGGASQFRALTLEEEYQLGEKVGALILGNYPPVNSSFNDYVSNMARYLALFSSRPVLFKGYRAHLVDCPDMAAISTPGGFIFLSKPIVEATINEDELAGILAHEVAHIVLRHGEMSIRRKAAAKKDREETEGLLDNLTDIADFFVPTDEDREERETLEKIKLDRKAYGEHLSDLMEVMKVYKYNNNQEYDADKLAIEILLDAGYHPGRFADFLARNFSTVDRLAKSNKSPVRMFETHPLDEDRVKRIRAAIKGWKPGPDSRTRDSRFAKFKALAAKAS